MAAPDAKTTGAAVNWEPSRDRRVVALLFVLIWAVYLATATYSMVQVNDQVATVASAWSLATQGTAAVPEAWEEPLRWSVRGQDGRVYTDRFPGIVWVTVPGYWLASLLGVAEQPSRPIFLNFVPAGITAATIAALAAAVMYGVFRELTGRRLAVGATLLFAFGTASWSVSADAIWTHGLTSLGIALGMLALARGRHALTGGALAIAILARPQTAVIPAVMGIWRGIERRDLRPILAVGITSAAGLAIVAVYSRVYFGTWLPIAGYTPSKVDAVVTRPSGEFLRAVGYTLLHRERGVLVFTPFLLVLLPFLHRGWRIAPGWVRSSAVAGLLYLVVQLRANTWYGGFGYFGSRLTIETLVLSAPLLLCTWQAVIRPDRILRAVFGAFAGLAVVIHALGATVLSPPVAERTAFIEGLVEACAEEDAPPECDSLDEYLPRLTWR